MTAAQLEHVVMVQAREMQAQRRVIERQAAKIKKLEADAQPRTPDVSVREAYRAGYRTGWHTANDGRAMRERPEQSARGRLREAVAA